MGFVRDLRVGREAAGTREFVSRVTRGIAAKVYWKERYEVIEQRIAEIVDIPAREGVRISLIRPEDAEDAAAILTSALRGEFERRLSAGRSCLLAWRGGRVIGYTWMSETINPDVEGLPLALPPEAAYLWDLFVIHAERSSGIGSALTSARLAWARDRGFELGWRAITPGNRPSLRTAEKTGTVRVLGEITSVSRGGRRSYREVRYEDRALLQSPSA